MYLVIFLAWIVHRDGRKKRFIGINTVKGAFMVYGIGIINQRYVCPMKLPWLNL